MNDLTLYIILNCYYEEEVVVYIITRSLLIYPSVSMIPWVSGDRDEGSKGARTGVSAGQVSHCRVGTVFWGKKIVSSVLGYQNQSLWIQNVLVLLISLLRQGYVMK